MIARFARLTAFLTALAYPALVHAQASDTAVSGALDRAFGQMAGAGGEPLSLSLQLLLVMGLLTILPALLLMMTSFTRIIVVLAILCQALGLQQSPPNQVLIGISLFLSMFIMAPTLENVNQNAIAPYSAGEIGAEVAIERAGDQFHAFMIRQTREYDLQMFADIADAGFRQHLAQLRLGDDAGAATSQGGGRPLEHVDLPSATQQKQGCEQAADRSADDDGSSKSSASGHNRSSRPARLTIMPL